VPPVCIFAAGQGYKIICIALSNTSIEFLSGSMNRYCEQCTLVALYGPKTEPLATVLRACQRIVKVELGDDFEPYDLAQIHGTVVGFEQLPNSNWNWNFAKLRGRLEAIDIDGYLAHLRSSSKFPLSIQIGGFLRHEIPFVSRGQVPYERTFSIQGLKVVLIGWPTLRQLERGASKASGRQLEARQLSGDVDARLTEYPTYLADIRRLAENFGILHQYHGSPAELDNDFYLRLGVLRMAIEPNRTRMVEERLRHTLASWPPTLISVELSSLHVIAYEDEQLPSASSSILCGVE